jgi:zinc protease
LVLTDPEYTQSRVDIYFKRKAELPSSNLAGYRNDIIAYLADTIISYRFNDATSKPQTPYMRAGAGTVRYGYGSRYYVLIGIAKTGLSAQVLEELLTIKESLSRYGFLEDEADMAKRALLSDMEQLAAEKDRQNSNYYISAFTRHFLEGETLPDIEWELNAIRTMLPGISLKEINQAVKNYFADDDLTIFVNAPDSERQSLPTENDIRLMAANVKRARIDPPVSTIIKGELLDETPYPGAILEEMVDEETGAIYWYLSNGMGILLKETANRNNEISFYGLARGGTMSVPDEDDVSASLAAEMLSASGLGPYSRPELIRALADKQVSFSFWASAFLRGFQGNAARGDLKVLMEMIHIGFTQPRLDADAVSILLEQRRTRLIQEAESPDRFFSREVTRTIYGNPRLHPMEVTDLERVSIDAAMDFIQLSLNPMDYTLVFTGSLSPDEMRPLVETYLASIPFKETSFDEWADMDFQRPGSTQREIRKGREERSTVYIGWFTPYGYSEEAMAAVSVLEEYLDIRLTEEIRETLGGVYSVSPRVSLSPLPRGELTGSIYFICNPDRAKELAAATVSQIREVAVGRINADTLTKSREALVMSHEQSVQGNLYIAQSYANSMVIYESPLTRMDKRPTLYQAVTAQDIQRIAARLLSGPQVEMILYPEGW